MRTREDRSACAGDGAEGTEEIIELNEELS